MAESSAFIGSWLVTEYVYTPAGEYAGHIHQRRILQPHGDLIRVTQICEPVQVVAHISDQARAAVDVMNQRVGEFVFDIRLVGQARHYAGEDVIGGGFSWKNGVLTARGVWPRFGYNFTSFSFHIHARRQVTGGTFSIANQNIVTIVGVATAEEEDFPCLPQEFRVSYDASGVRYLISPNGALLTTDSIRASDIAFVETGLVRGRTKQYGALREICMVSAPGEIVTAIEVHDSVSGCLTGIRKVVRDEVLHQVQVYVLTNAGRTPDIADGRSSSVCN